MKLSFSQQGDKYGELYDITDEIEAYELQWIIENPQNETTVTDNEVINFGKEHNIDYENVPKKDAI